MMSHLSLTKHKRKSGVLYFLWEDGFNSLSHCLFINSYRNVFPEGLFLMFYDCFDNRTLPEARLHSPGDESIDLLQWRPHIRGSTRRVSNQTQQKNLLLGFVCLILVLLYRTGWSWTQETPAPASRAGIIVWTSTHESCQQVLPEA